jgi:hypothetical protein
MMSARVRKRAAMKNVGAKIVVTICIMNGDLFVGSKCDQSRPAQPTVSSAPHEKAVAKKIFL